MGSVQSGLATMLAIKKKSILNTSFSGTWASPSKSEDLVFGMGVTVKFSQKKPPAFPRLNKVRDALADCKIVLINSG